MVKGIRLGDGMKECFLLFVELAMVLGCNVFKCNNWPLNRHFSNLILMDIPSPALTGSSTVIVGSVEGKHHLRAIYKYARVIRNR